MKSNVTSIFVATALLCGIFTPAISISSEQSDPVYTVKSSSQSNNITLGGTVIPWKIVKLSAQMPGEVKSIAGSEGDFFKQDSILVTLNTGTLLAKRRSAEAQLDSANAALSNARMQFQRELQNPNSQSNSMMGGLPAVMDIMTEPVRNASGRGGNSGIDRAANLHQYQVQVETAQNQIRQALAGIREIDENLLNSTSIAPFNGTILNKMAEVGDIIQPGMPLIVFADTSRLQAQVEVPNRLLSQLSLNQKLLARLDGSHSDIQVRVARIFPMAELGSHTTTVKFDLPLNISAHAGMYISVKINDKQPNNPAQPMIPESSIVWRGSLPAVFLIDKNQRLKMQLIRLGNKTDPRHYAIISGLHKGDKILTQANASTRSGQIVHPVSTQKSAEKQQDMVQEPLANKEPSSNEQ